MKSHRFLPLVLTAFWTLTGCKDPGETLVSGASQGTTWSIKIVPNDTSVSVDDIRADAEAVFQRVDERLSNWRNDSEISRFNQQKDTDWHPVSPEIIVLTTLARDVYEKTHGCFDLTVKPLFDLWGFARHELSVPTPEEIARIRTHIGMDKLEIDPERSRIRKQDPVIEISMDSIAQGYTVSVLSQLLENRGIQDYLVEVGGEMKVKGHKADGSAWRIAIEKPIPMTREIQRVLELNQTSGIAVMTSGTYRNFHESGGKTYSHIIDPRTGKPVTHRLLSTTVMHEDPTLADAWSTALLCVGEAEGSKLVESEHLHSLFIYREADQLKEEMSTTFKTVTAP